MGEADREPAKQREEVGLFESAGVHVINDIFYYPVAAGAQRYFSFLIWGALCVACVPCGAVGCRAWVWKQPGKTLSAKVQGDTLVLL